MKKFLVLLVVLTLTVISSVAFAADVTVGGSVEVRSRAFSTMSFYEKDSASDAKDTQQRIRLDVNAKAGDVKGKIQLESDFGNGTSINTDWGHFESYPASTMTGTSNNNIGFREAWINFNLPGVPVNVTAGHQLLTLGNGGFLRSQHYGSDAWVFSNTMGDNTAGFINIKSAENSINLADDEDIYVIFDSYKLSDTMIVGVDLSDVKDRSGAAQSDLQNLGINFKGKVGPLDLKAEFDQNMGDQTTAGVKKSYKGSQIVVQGSMPLAPVTLNVTFGMGTGQDTSSDITVYKSKLDIDPHYTFMYEYKLNTAAGAKNTGFANTTAIGVGASMAVLSNLSVALDIFNLTASEKTNQSLTKSATGAAVAHGAGATDIGNEIDITVKWKLADNLNWNWNVGYFMPGAVYKDAAGNGKDAATGITGILALKF